MWSEAPQQLAVLWQFVRTTSAYQSWVPAIIAFAKWAKWTKLVLLSSTDRVFAAPAAELALRMPKVSSGGLPHVQFEHGTFDAQSLDRVGAMRLRAVAVMAETSDIVAIAMAAAGRGMLNTGWAWLGLDTVFGAETFAVGNSEAARAAMHGWLYFEPHTVTLRGFPDRVREATHAHFPLPFGSGTEQPAVVTPFAANMYDAVVLFYTAFERYSSQRTNRSSIIDEMMHTSFDGMTGTVELDGNGDRKQHIRAVNYVRVRGSMRTDHVGVYDGVTRTYSVAPNATITWPGNVLLVPLDADEEITEAGFSTSWVSMGAASGAVVLLAAALVFLRKRYRHLRDLLVMVFSEMVELVGSICMDVADVVTDWIACYLVLSGDVAVPSRLFKTLYPATAALGTVSMVLSLVYRIRSARLVRQHMEELAAEQEKTPDPQGAQPTAPSPSRVASYGQASGEQAETPDPQGAQPNAPSLSRVASLVQASGGRLRLVRASWSQQRDEDSRGEPARHARRYEYELKQSHRAIVMQALHMLTVVVEGTSFIAPR
jgi:hypothetical protein